MTQMYLNVNHSKVSLNHHTVTWDAPKCNQLKMYSIHTKQNHLQHMSMIQQTGHIKKERDGQKSGLLEGLIKYYLQSGTVHIPW